MDEEKELKTSNLHSQKKAQEETYHLNLNLDFSNLHSQKKAQEEMVGFALIIIIVSVILLTFLFFSIKGTDKDNIESSEVNSFIQASLEYTSECRDNLEFLSVRKLIFSCIDKESCLNEKNACDVLKTTLEGLSQNSWEIGEDTPTKGYLLNITNNKGEVLSFQHGNKTANSKGSVQDFARSGEQLSVFFVVYF